MEGLSAVQARIAEIRQLVHPMVVGPVRPAKAPQADFAATLAEATRQAAPTTAPTTPPGTGQPGATARPAVPFSIPGMTTPAAPAPVVAPLVSSAQSVGAFKAAYANGQVPPSALTTIGRGDHRLAAPAAAGFAQLEAAAARDGISFGVNDSYRSLEEQVALVRSKGLYSEGGLAAKPGTSQHGWGLAVDLQLDPAAQQWMRANGPRFGFVEDTPREPWHWTFKG